MQLNRLRIGTRLSLGFGSLMALLIVITALAVFQFKHVQRDFKDVGEMERRASAAADWRRLTELNMNRAFAIVKSGGHATVEAYFAPEVKKTSAQISDIQKFLETAVESENGKAALGRIAATRKLYIASRDEVFQQVKAGDVAKTEALIAEKMMPAAGTYLSELEAFHKIQTGLLSERGDIVTQSASTAMVMVSALAAVGICMGVFFAWLITRSVTMPLNQAVKATRAVASGDLSQRFEVQGSDEAAELLTSLDDMQQSLKKLIGDVRSSTESISTASGEIATGNQDLSQRTEQTASNLQQTASSMEQLTGTVKQTADSARTANQLANSAQATAAKGGEVVSQVVSTMEEINASSKKIADIIGVIDGIAFQTNILALNAAVEAARAGEQGRGFAVVASEVRSLAQRSANAAKEIKGLIGASVEKVESGTRLVADAGQTMSEIVGSVQRVSDIINEITAAASEQSDGIGQVNQAVTTLDQMTQQNAALVEQSAAAAESLKDQANRLSSSVSLFKLGANDSPRATSDAAPKALPAPGAPVVAKKPVVPPRPAVPKPIAAKPAAPHASAAAASPASPAPAAATASAGGDWETF